MSERTFYRWVEISEAEPVTFAKLLRLMVEASHSDAFAQAVAESNLETELRDLVDAGELMVRNPSTLGRCTFTIGDALHRAVLLPHEDVRPLLESRGIGLRLIPFGTGPTHWTIENAAAAIAAQEGWHNGARDTLRDHMLQAAHEGTLTVRHPHTGKAFRPDTVRAFYELVTPADVCAWFALDPIAGLQWNVTAPAIAELARAAAKAKSDVEPAPVSPTRPLTSPQLADAFDGVELTVDKWRTKLGDTNNHQWLLPAQRSKGTAPNPSTWCPVAFADLLHKRGTKPAELNRCFLTVQALKPWLAEWQEATRERNNFGQ